MIIGKLLIWGPVVWIPGIPLWKGLLLRGTPTQSTRLQTTKLPFVDILVSHIIINNTPLPVSVYFVVYISFCWEGDWPSLPPFRYQSSSSKKRNFAARGSRNLLLLAFFEQRKREETRDLYSTPCNKSNLGTWWLHSQYVDRHLHWVMVVVSSMRASQYFLSRSGVGDEQFDSLWTEETIASFFFTP